MSEKPTFGQLKQLRNTPEYPAGEIIGVAADLALDVGPARKHRPKHIKPIARRAVSESTEIDFAGIDDFYAKQLVANKAPGWTEVDTPGEISESQS